MSSRIKWADTDPIDMQETVSPSPYSLNFEAAAYVLQFHDMSSGMSRLKKQCDDLKAERQILTSDCAQRSTDRASLQTEIDQLRAERDSLRIEYRGALDKDRWWSQYDQTASVEFDGQGKLKRRIWLLEQRDEKHLKEMTDVQKGHQEDLEVQMATAAGLRDRIGTLELKVRTAKKDITSADVRETELKRELESVKSIHAAEDMKLRSEWQDMRDMLGKARAEVTSLKQQLETLGSEKQAVQEALIRVKGTKTTVAARSVRHSMIGKTADFYTSKSPPCAPAEVSKYHAHTTQISHACDTY